MTKYIFRYSYNSRNRTPKVGHTIQEIMTLRLGRRNVYYIVGFILLSGGVKKLISMTFIVRDVLYLTCLFMYIKLHAGYLAYI